nr:MAG TPA: hypothetical protein [Caudoviricetes sp.]
MRIYNNICLLKVQDLCKWILIKIYGGLLWKKRTEM